MCNRCNKVILFSSGDINIKKNCHLNISHTKKISLVGEQDIKND